MRTCFLAFMVLLFPFTVTAQDDLRERAKEAWQHRDDLDRAQEAAGLYEKLAEEDPADTDVRIRLARATYWVIEADEILSGVRDTHRMGKNKQAMYADKGIAACREVLDIDSENHRAHYWMIWNMAARTLAKGLFSGFAFKDSVLGTIMVSKADHSYMYGGIYRYWARIIYEMPGLLGRFFHFTDEDSVTFYKKSIAIQPNYLRTHFWLAETYEKRGREKKARKAYQFCVDLPEGSLPEVAPENRLYRLWAEKRLEKM